MFLSIVSISFMQMLNGYANGGSVFANTSLLGKKVREVVIIVFVYFICYNL